MKLAVAGFGWQTENSMRGARAERLVWCWALALALVVCPLSAWADNAADEADLAFSLGNEAYAKRDYERALAEYFLSNRLVPNRNVLFNIARCFEALGRFDEAYRYWFDLSVDPGVPEGDLKEVKLAMAHLVPKVALVAVTTTPPGAELYVDRRDLGSRGRTPQTIAVPPGPHTLLVELPGYRPTQVKVTAWRGREARVAPELVQLVGKVTLSGTPVGATVHATADGPALGRLPTTLQFPPGQRLLSVLAPGFLPQQVLVDVKADEEVVARVSLPEKPPPTGKVVVTANRENALVRIDGRNAGFTPTVVTLPVGDHELEVSADDVVPLTQPLHVDADTEQRVSAELRYAPPQVEAASKTALSVDQAPASVTVITREELRGFGYQTLAEALRAVRGLFLTDDRLYTYIGLRGFQPAGDLNTRLLVLWDGHAMNDVWAGQGYSARDFEVDLGEVERIEIVRGPASILFGTGAFFGVINVVPRDSLGSKHVEAVAGGGGQNGGKLRLTGGLQGDGAAVMGSVAGFLAEGAPVTDLEAGPVRGLDGERSLGASVRARAGDFTLLGKLTQRRKQAPTAPYGAQLGVPGTEYTDARGFAELRFAHTWDRVSLNVRASYDGSRYRGYYAQLDDQGGTYRTTDSGGADWMGAEVRASVRLFGKNQLTVALEGSGQFITQQAMGNDVPSHQMRFVISGTLLDEWQIFSKLFLQAGVRFDKYFDVPDLAVSPRGALVAKLYDQGVTKVVVGQAFRAPNTYELYFEDNYVSQHVPTTPLRPELITTFELEHSHDFTPELRATVGGYFNLIDRLVVTTEDPVMPPQCGGADPVPCVMYMNAPGRVLAGGVEGELRWRPGRFTLVSAAYSFVLLKPASGEESYTYPTHLASVRALVPVYQGLVRLSTQATYQSARTASDGVTSGESLHLDLGFSGEYGFLRYFAGVQNLLDQRPLLPVSSEVGNGRVPQYGRTFFIELAASL